MKKLSKSAWIKITAGSTCAIILALTLFFIFNKTSTINTYEQYINSLKTLKAEQGMQGLKKRNSDFVAWLDCDDVGISIPIVTSPIENREFYLNHNFDKQNNDLGSPYKYSSSTLGKTSNTTIIGHSAYMTTTMSGEQIYQSIMGNFSKYVNATDTSNFNYKIKIETMTSTFNYEVASAFMFDSTKDCAQETQLFNVVNLKTEQEFNDYIDIIKSLSAKDYNLTATLGDKFITLYTCSFDEGYKIMIIAKQID